MNRLRQTLIALSCIVVLIAGCGAAEQTGKLSPPQQSASIGDPVQLKAEYKENIDTSQLVQTTIDSKALAKTMKMTVYLPKQYNKNNTYPVLYILHGAGGNETNWMPGLGLNVKADELIDAGKIKPIIIVAPHYDSSYGINAAEKPRVHMGDRMEGPYEDFLYGEVIAAVDAHFSTKKDRQSRYIGGVSMGGFAALHIALRHPESFSKAGGHSPALQTMRTNEPVYKWLYPSTSERKARDPIMLAETARLDGLEFYLDCGDEDSFSSPTRELADVLQRRNARLQYHDNPGKHNSAYTKAYLEQYLLFYAGT